MKRSDNIEKFYTCRYDRAFKEVFMKESNKDILIALLESILNIEIKEISYLNLEKNVDNVNIKKKHFDFHVKTEKENIQIEINSEIKNYTRIRNLTYLLDTYSHAIQKGEEYNNDTTFIQINFTYGLSNSIYYDKNDENINIYKFKNQKGKILVNNIIYYEFNMDYFVNLWYTKNEKEIEKYKYIIMMDLERDELENLSKKDKVVSKYMSEINRVNEDPEIREWISVEKDNQMIENSLKRQYREEGLAEGRAEGRAKGRAEGRAEGIEQGKKIATVEMINELKKCGMDANTISKITKLSIDEINELMH